MHPEHFLMYHDTNLVRQLVFMISHLSIGNQGIKHGKINWLAQNFTSNVRMGKALDQSLLNLNREPVTMITSSLPEYSFIFVFNQVNLIKVYLIKVNSLFFIVSTPFYFRPLLSSTVETHMMPGCISLKLRPACHPYNDTLAAV